MPWTDQDPPATDIVLSARFTIHAKSAHVEIDKLPDGSFRATTGNLFGHQELARNADLESLLRQVEGFVDEARKEAARNA